VRAYLHEGLRQAYAFGNRGPIRFEGDGNIHPEIVDAYSRYGFYVFENVLQEEELADIRADLQDIQERLPIEPNSPVDKHGRPALGADHEARTLEWAKPLSDPLGGTNFANGRHRVKLIEPEAAADAPADIVLLVIGSLQFSEAALRVYGHPQLLEIAAQINGEDFVPFNEVLIIKEPGLGAAISWHQDGTTHWDSPDLDEGTHGFNFMAQLYGSDPVNGVWVNTGLTPRVTVNFGFHRRSSVLGLVGAGFHSEPQAYSEERIRERSRMIGYAIDARHQRFPNETPYVYRPFIESGESYHWDEKAKADIKDYSLLDMSI
jgi:hypothetical protein